MNRFYFRSDDKHDFREISLFDLNPKIRKISLFSSRLYRLYNFFRNGKK